MFFVQTGFDCSKILLQFWGSQNCISFPVSAFSGFRSDFWGSKNFEIHTNHANLPEKWLNFGRVKNPMERVHKDWLKPSQGVPYIGMFFFLVEAEADELNITEKVCEVGRSRHGNAGENEMPTVFDGGNSWKF